MTRASAPGTGLMHEALFYRDDDDYVAGIQRYLSEGLEQGEPLLVAVPGRHIELLEAALGSDAGRVKFVDMAKTGRNPGVIIPTVLYAFAHEHAPSRVRVVGEPIWPGRTPAEYRAALQHEALINLALADQSASILCPYDQRSLDAIVLADARRTHPLLVERDVHEASGDYTDPRVVADACLRSLPEPPQWWGDMFVFSSSGELRAVRRFVENIAQRAGLAPNRVADLCLAVNEVATNTLQHTGEPGIITMWQDFDFDTLVCEVSDSGHLADRLVGRIPPPSSSPGGRGLILVNTLCDLVELPTGQMGSGTTLRLHMQLR